MKYAFVRNGEIIKTIEQDIAPDAVAPNKGVWLPVVENLIELTDTQTVSLTIDIQEDQVVYTQVAELKPLSILKERKKAQAINAFNTEFWNGFTVAEGPLEGHTLQVRNLEDRTNWLTSKGEYQTAIAAGYGDVQQALFRTQANDSVIVTFSEGYTVLSNMAKWGQTKYARLWALKDEIEAAETYEDLAAIDVTTGWNNA